MVARVLLHHGSDQVLRDAAEAEATDEQRVTRLDVLDCLLCARENLLGEAPPDPQTERAPC